LYSSCHHVYRVLFVHSRANFFCLNQFFTTYQPYFKNILKLSYPIIIGQLGVVLMGVADIIMIGNLAPVNLAAASLANAIYFFIAILGIGTLTAVSPLVAKSKAEGHNNDCAILFRQAYYAALILSLLITVVLIFLAYQLSWFKQDIEVELLTKNYLHVLNAGTFPLLIFLALKQYSDGLSFTKPSAVITLIAVLLNVALNWIFIYGKLGVKPMGLFGAGIATTISRIFMAVAMFVYIYNAAVYHNYIKLKDKTINTHFLRKIFTIGLPSGLQYFFEVGAFAGAAIIIGWFGKEQLAAHQIAINIASVTYMVATGFSAAGSILVGEAWGRKDKSDMIKAGRASLIMGFGFMALMALVFAFGNELLVSFYTTDTAVAPMAANLLLIAALFQLSDGVQCVSLGILRGIADTKVPTIITIVAYWVIGIPSGWLMAKYANLSLNGIWFGLCAGLTFSAYMLSIRFLKESKSFQFVADMKKQYKELVNEA